jgi:outer membrane lipoprotein-sorting protein
LIHFFVKGGEKMNQITLKMVSMLGLLAVLIVSVTGCTSSTSGTQRSTDYSNYYTSSYSANNVVVTPFYKTTSNYGNDFYVGVVRNFFSSPSGPRTITLELMPTEAQAGQIYQTTVTDARNAGYVARATAPSGYEVPTVHAWQGD